MKKESPSLTSQFAPSLVLVGGESGAGKTSTINALLGVYDKIYERPISYTSRPRRDGEGDEEYKFVTRDEILSMFSSGDVLTIDEVYGDLYAMNRDSVDDILKSGKIPIKEIHPKNFSKIQSIIPDLITVLFVSDLSLNVTSDRHIRGKEDLYYYCNQNSARFDLLLRFDSSRSPSANATNLHYLIYSLLTFRHYFPKPSEIDLFNSIGYSKVAAEFDGDNRPTTRDFHVLSKEYFNHAVDKYIKEGMTCLEIGPGSDWLRRTITLSEVKYYSIDISVEMIRLYNQDTIQTSARYIDFPDNTFEVVLSSLADPYLYPSAICEIRRVLTQNGVFIFSCPTKSWSQGIRARGSAFITSFSLQNNSKVEVYSFTFNNDELSMLLSLCGLEIIESKSAYADNIMNTTNISEAIINSSANQNIDLSELPILDLVVAKKI